MDGVGVALGREMEGEGGDGDREREREREIETVGLGRNATRRPLKICLSKPLRSVRIPVDTMQEPTGRLISCRAHPILPRLVPVPSSTGPTLTRSL